MRTLTTEHQRLNVISPLSSPSGTKPTGTTDLLTVPPRGVSIQAPDLGKLHKLERTLLAGKPADEPGATDQNTANGPGNAIAYAALGKFGAANQNTANEPRSRVTLADEPGAIGQETANEPGSTAAHALPDEPTGTALQRTNPRNLLPPPAN